jgi:hypothetical protein
MAATMSRTATQKSTLEECFIFLLSDISQGAIKALSRRYQGAIKAFFI